MPLVREFAAEVFGCDQGKPELNISQNPDEAVVVTEKDIVKYRGEVPDNLWVLEVEMPLSKKFIDDICCRAGVSRISD